MLNNVVFYSKHNICKIFYITTFFGMKKPEFDNFQQVGSACTPGCSDKFLFAAHAF